MKHCVCSSICPLVGLNCVLQASAATSTIPPSCCTCHLAWRHLRLINTQEKSFRKQGNGIVITQHQRASTSVSKSNIVVFYCYLSCVLFMSPAAGSHFCLVSHVYIYTSKCAFPKSIHDHIASMQHVGNTKSFLKSKWLNSSLECLLWSIFKDVSKLYCIVHPQSLWQMQTMQLNLSCRFAAVSVMMEICLRWSSLTALQTALLLSFYPHEVLIATPFKGEMIYPFIRCTWWTHPGHESFKTTWHRKPSKTLPIQIWKRCKERRWLHHHKFNRALFIQIRNPKFLFHIFNHQTHHFSQCINSAFLRLKKIPF